MNSVRFSWDAHLRRLLAGNAEHGLPDLIPALDWLHETFLHVEFTRFICVTFKYPETDLLKLEKLNQSIGNRLKRAFYGRSARLQKQLKLLFVNEQYEQRVYPLPDYHLHILMNEPVRSGRECDFFCCDTEEHFDRVIRNCLKGSTFTNSNSTYQPIADIDIRAVENQADRIAYVMKALAKPHMECVIDLRNSTFPSHRDVSGVFE